MLARPPGIVSLTGGGGKTSLLFALAEAFANAGLPVVCATTTKMMRPTPSAWLDVDMGPLPQTPPPNSRALFAAKAADPSGKVAGYAPAEIDALQQSRPGWILVEADGAARKPVKAPAAHEPPLPALTTIAIAVVGLSCIGQTLSDAVAFRLPELSAITGLRPGDEITPETLARLADHPQGMFKNVPAAAERILFCNQSDLPGAEEAGKRLVAEIEKTAPRLLDGAYLGAIQKKGLTCLSLTPN